MPHMTGKRHTLTGARIVTTSGPPPVPRVQLQSNGRQQHRNYCAACGAKKIGGECPRGHPC